MTSEPRDSKCSMINWYLLLPLNIGTVCQYQYDSFVGSRHSGCMESNGTVVAFSVALRDTSGAKPRRPESWHGFSSLDALR
jgi:hypothetical protein